jgi:hypothetical protein
MKKRLKSCRTGLMGLWFGLSCAWLPGEARAEPLAWVTNQAATAIATAKSQGKLILLLAGRDSCGYCQYMKKTVCETLDPPINTVLQDYYVPWYCQVDVCSDWRPYADGLGTFSLPLICVIDPHHPQAYLDSTTGVQPPEPFLQRLLQYVKVTTAPPPPKLKIRRAANGQLEITWPNDKKWKLQSMSAETTLGWQDVPSGFEVKDGQSLFLFNPAINCSLFRLAPTGE